ncbi:unnamed protein product, partial [Prorocentrum cordatum]
PVISEFATVAVLASRAWRPGIMRPSEKTKMAVAAFVLARHYSGVTMVAAEKKRFIADMAQSRIKGLDKAEACPHGRGKTCATPQGFAQSVYRLAWPNPADPAAAFPPEVDVAEIKMVRGNTAAEFKGKQLGKQFQQQRAQRARALPHSSAHLPPLQTLADVPRNGDGAAAAAAGAGGAPETAPVPTKTSKADAGDAAAAPRGELGALEPSILASAKAKRKRGASA